MAGGRKGKKRKFPEKVRDWERKEPAEIRTKKKIGERTRK